MAQKKVGELIKEARTKKGLSQEKLAGMVEGLSASELSKAERGEKDLTAAELKAIAKICGVTQKSLLEAAGLVTAQKPATSAAKKPAASSAKKPATTTAKKPAATDSSVKLTAAEKKFLELYRAASSAARKDAEAVLKGTKKVQEDSDTGDLVGSLLGGALEALTGLGKK
ncbi:MAG: helix-turn-helix transcriptional regulator [Clostridia bacterium]|nr:helix-turn-helix transcriptional regulator [Clostridia bacterium]MBQ6961256.1 helix-turn-helix transcriptional regulator [Clostridia bacterium]